jgi:hypothetical protein
VTTTADEPSTQGRVGSLLSTAASVVAPLSVLSALLFYFGYASSRAQYAYFGIDVDTIGLSTQDYVLRSPQSLLTPLLGFLVLGIAGATVHEGVRRSIEAARRGATDADDATAALARGRLQRSRRGVRLLVMVASVLLVAGVLLLLAYGQLEDWPPYPLLTPVLLGVGAGLALYGRGVTRLIDPGNRSGAPATLAVALVLATSVFWVTATLAEWSGRGAARDAANDMDRFPAVILDTTERLHLTSPGIEEVALEPFPGSTFLYRYRGFRLLIEGGDRLFLVPPKWTASNSTLVVPMDSSVRLQFRFQNSSP